MKLVDLGSRNGTWVNEEKIVERLLQAGDRVRLGSLEILLEAEPVPDRTLEADVPEEADESTVVLATKGDSPPEAGTVVLEPQSPHATRVSPADDAPPVGAGTVVLGPAPSVGAAASSEGTVMFSSDAAPEDDSRTQIVSKSPVQPETATIQRVSHSPERAERSTQMPATVDLETEPVPKVVPEAPPSAAWSLSPKLALLLFGLGGPIFLLPTWLLTHGFSRALSEESLLRGRVILDAMVAKNEARLASEDELSVADFENERGVDRVWIVDNDGAVVAASASAEPSVSLGVDRRPADIRTFYLGRRDDGRYVLGHPLFRQGRREGVAVMIFDASTADLGMAPLFALLFVAAGLWVLYLLVVRLVLSPLHILTSGVEAVEAGTEAGVALPAAYAEVEELATGINRLARRAATTDAPSRTVLYGDAGGDERPSREAAKGNRD